MINFLLLRRPGLALWAGTYGLGGTKDWPPVADKITMVKILFLLPCLFVSLCLAQIQKGPYLPEEDPICGKEILTRKTPIKVILQREMKNSWRNCGVTTKAKTFADFLKEINLRPILNHSNLDCEEKHPHEDEKTSSISCYESYKPLLKYIIDGKEKKIGYKEEFSAEERKLMEEHYQIIDKLTIPVRPNQVRPHGTK